MLEHAFAVWRSPGRAQHRRAQRAITGAISGSATFEGVLRSHRIGVEGAPRHGHVKHHRDGRMCAPPVVARLRPA